MRGAVLHFGVRERGSGLAERSEATGIALIYLPVGVDPNAVFAGRTLLQRSVALARAAGLQPYLVAKRAIAVRSEGGAIPCLEPASRLPLALEPHEVVALWRCDVAWTAAALRAIVRRAESARVAAIDDLGRPALVGLDAGRLAGVVPASVAIAAGSCAIPDRPGHFAGARLIALDAGAAPAVPVEGAAKPASGAVRAVPAGGVASAAPAAARGMPPARAAIELVATLENPRDGAFDTLFNRHLSRRITPFLLGLPVLPNHVTLLSLLIGLLAAAALAQPGILWPIAGALLLQLTAVLDCIDGEIARAKVLESDWGELLDITTDSVIHVVVFLGMAVHAWPELGVEAAWTLGAVFATGGFAAFVVVTRAERTEERWKALGVWQGELLGKMLATLTTRDLSVLVLVAAATGMMTELLKGAAVGAHVFWITTLLLHRDLMRRVAAAERRPAAAPTPEAVASRRQHTA